MGRVGLETACAETASRVWRGVKGVKASTTKTAGGMKAATVKPASGTKTTATVEAATAPTVETAATMKTTAAATATARLGYVCEPESHSCANQDPSERQRNLFAAPSSQHSFLHLSRRQLERPAVPEAS